MEPEFKLDGWCEGIHWQQRNDGGSCETMKRVERSGTCVTE